MSRHKDIYEEAVEAIYRVHGDTSVPASKTLSSLHGLRDEVTTLIEATEPEAENDTDFWPEGDEV